MQKKKTMVQKSCCGIRVKAWCDGKVIKKWISEQWGNVVLCPPKSVSSGKILFADIHKAQQTDIVKIMLKKHKTTLINVLDGKTSLVHQLKISINKFSKNYSRTTLT